jgi:hypothetical protein
VVEPKKRSLKENVLTTLASTNSYHNQVNKFFEKTALEKARETKFVQRKSVEKFAKRDIRPWLDGGS